MGNKPTSPVDIAIYRKGTDEVSKQSSSDLPVYYKKDNDKVTFKKLCDSDGPHSLLYDRSSETSAHDGEPDSPHTQFNDSEADSPHTQLNDIEPYSPHTQFNDSEPDSPHIQLNDSEPDSPHIQFNDSEPDSPHTQFHDSEPDSPHTQFNDSEPDSPHIQLNDSEPDSPHTQYNDSEPYSPHTQYNDSEPYSPHIQLNDSEPDSPHTQYNDSEPDSPHTQLNDSEPDGPHTQFHDGASDVAIHRVPQKAGLQVATEDSDSSDDGRRNVDATEQDEMRKHHDYLKSLEGTIPADKKRRLKRILENVGRLRENAKKGLAVDKNWREQNHFSTSPVQTEKKKNLLFPHEACKGTSKSDEVKMSTARVLNITNEFLDHSDRVRHGADKDRDGLREIFIDKLKYEDFLDTITSSNLDCLKMVREELGAQIIDNIHRIPWTISQMKLLVKTIATTPYEGDALIVTFGTHGGAKDGKTVLYGDDLECEYFDQFLQILNDCHESLKGKLKFILVQGCRGVRIFQIAEHMEEMPMISCRNGKQMAASPVGQMTASPVGQMTASPLGQMTASPVGQMTASPVGQMTASPVGQMTASPVGQMTASPLGQMTASPLGQMTASPVGQMTASPVGQMAASPVGQMAASPVGQMAASPVGQMTASPVGQMTASPVGQMTASPVGQMAASPVGRSDEQTYHFGGFGDVDIEVYAKGLNLGPRLKPRPHVGSSPVTTQCSNINFEEKMSSSMVATDNSKPVQESVPDTTVGERTSKTVGDQVDFKMGNTACLGEIDFLDTDKNRSGAARNLTKDTASSNHQIMEPECHILPDKCAVLFSTPPSFRSGRLVGKAWDPGSIVTQTFIDHLSECITEHGGEGINLRPMLESVKQHVMMEHSEMPEIVHNLSTWPVLYINKGSTDAL